MRSSKRIGKITIAALVVVGCVIGVKYARYHIVARGFAEVVPDHIYRSAYLESGPLRRVIDEHHIRTIVSLLSPDPDSPMQQQETAIINEKGVQFIQIGMPGDGRGDFDKLEQAAAVLADEKMHPVLVHCHAGVNRTGAVCAVWRMKYCGWTAEQALAEAEERGYSPSRNPPMREHLLEYYRTRIAAPQPATTSAASSPAR